MSDLEKYIEKRKEIDPDFAEGYEVGYQNFKIGAILKKIRKDSGITQEELANKLSTKKSVISRIENHAEDIRLSTLNRYASSLGRSLKIKLVKN